MKVHHHNYTARKKWTQLILLLIIFYAIPFSILNAQPLKRVPVTSYNTNEGLLHSQVIDIAEDGNGFIWLSTGNGVQRFDGTRFHKITVSKDNKGIPNDKNVGFLRRPNGNILLLHQHGISEYVSQTNRFRNLIGFVKPTFTGKLICEEQDGIWFSQGRIIYKLDVKNRLADSIVLSSLINTTGNDFFVIGDLESGYHHFVAFNVRQIVIFDRSAKTTKIFTPDPEEFSYLKVQPYKNDTVLICTVSGIKKLDLHSGYKEFIHPLIARQNPTAMAPLQNGQWIIGDGPHVFDLDIKSGNVLKLVSFRDQLIVDVGFIIKAFEDSKNNVWLLTVNDGIRKLSYGAPSFRYFGTKEGKNNFVKCIYAHKEKNRILCGSFGSGLLLFDTTGALIKIIDRFPLQDPPTTVAGIHKIKDDIYLLLLQGSWNAFLLDARTYKLKKVKIDTSRNPLAHLADYHLTVHSINDSVFLLQNSFHVYRSTLSASGTLTFSLLKDLPSASISSCLTSSEQFWVGGREGKYFIFPPGLNQFKEFSLPEKILIRCIEEDRSGRMWMGTENGLYCLDKEGKIINTINKSNGLPDENIYAIREDEKGNLWVSHNKGISCIKPDESMLHYNKTDGLQENEFNTNTSFKTPDGELFFGGVNGISSFYPGETIRKTSEPDVLLTNIKIKDIDWKKDTAYWNLKKIVLPHYSNTLSFDFTTIGSRNNNNYQYQLVGLDAGWVNSGTDKQMRYVLEPGEYILKYTPGNSFEKDPTHVKELLIIIKPPFWKTTWFIIAVTILLAGLIIFITRKIAQAKLKRRIYELEGIKALDEERTRISREMHDDIGAGLTRIALMSEAAKRSEENKQQLDEIANTSRKLVGNMSEIIWSLNPENNSLEQLLGYMREQLHQLLEHSGIDYSIDFPEGKNEISLDNAQRRNLLLINKEIVHNAVKHSKATQLSINCKQKNSFLEFVIGDNGLGFDTTKTFRGHGLQNIRRRIAELGGTLQIESTEQGSVFSYRIPLSNL